MSAGMVAPSPRRLALTVVVGVESRALCARFSLGVRAGALPLLETHRRNAAGAESRMAPVKLAETRPAGAAEPPSPRATTEALEEWLQLKTPTLPARPPPIPAARPRSVDTAGEL